jgi:hypothetical protein
MGKGQALEVEVNKRDELVERLKAWALEELLRRSDYAETNALGMKGPAKDALIRDLTAALRAIAEDFSFHAGHNPACDSLHWEKRECDCEVSKKLARWRLR